jgi:hypothetical protein
MAETEIAVPVDVIEQNGEETSFAVRANQPFHYVAVHEQL